MRLLLLLLSVQLLALTLAYPNGPPEDCSLTAPGHDGAVEQDTPAPVRIQISKVSQRTTERGVLKLRRQQEQKLKLAEGGEDEDPEVAKRKAAALVRKTPGGSHAVSGALSGAARVKTAAERRYEERRRRIQQRKKLQEERRRLKEKGKEAKDDGQSRESRQDDDAVITAGSEGEDSEGEVEEEEVVWYRVRVRFNLDGFNLDGTSRNRGAKGLLLRPQKGVEGTFRSWPKRSFKSLEDGKCVSHSNARFKRRAVFIFETAADAPEPKFEGIVVGKDSQEWWSFTQEEDDE